MLLLDTNALIIMMFGNVANGKLSRDAIEKMENAEKIFVSEISFWEIAIKVKIGKLNINKPIGWIVSQCRSNGIETIPVTIEQFEETMNIPLCNDHADPFDRLILAVTRLNGMTLISTDLKMQKHKDEYNVNVIW